VAHAERISQIFALIFFALIFIDAYLLTALYAVVLNKERIYCSKDGRRFAPAAQLHCYIVWLLRFPI